MSFETIRQGHLGIKNREMVINPSCRAFQRLEVKRWRNNQQDEDEAASNAERRAKADLKKKKSQVKTVFQERRRLCQIPLETKMKIRKSTLNIHWKD